MSFTIGWRHQGPSQGTLLIMLGFLQNREMKGNELSFNEERQLTDGVEVADQEVARNGRKGGQAGQRLGWMPKPSTRSTAAS